VGSSLSRGFGPPAPASYLTALRSQARLGPAAQAGERLLERDGRLQASLARRRIEALRRLDAELHELERQIRTRVRESGTGLVELVGIGDLIAARVIGEVGDVRRIETKDRFARLNGTAPIPASSKPSARHRLNKGSNRRLNHAIHMMALTQARMDARGRAYVERRRAEGRTKRDAVRALKRHLSDVVYAQLCRDARALEKRDAANRLRRGDTMRNLPPTSAPTRSQRRASGPCLEAPRRQARLNLHMAAGIPVMGVNELVLEVLDLEAAENFYAGVLGLPVVERWSHRDALWVMAGERTRIGLWRPQVGIAGSRGGIHVHYAMQLADADYEAAVERLRRRGLEIEEFLHEDRLLDGRPSRAVFVSDPDGNVIELWTWDVAQHLAQ
jgi:catechol 2,3-dioxygenase-like lactoylglutathione lyase family enzyme